MAVTTFVSFQPIKREEVPGNENCSVCLETTTSDNGRSWWAHPAGKGSSQLIHYIHEICLRRMAFYQSNCSLCRATIDQDSIPKPPFLERIWKIVDKHAEQIPILISGLLFYSPVWLADKMSSNVFLGLFIMSCSLSIMGMDAVHALDGVTAKKVNLFFAAIIAIGSFDLGKNGISGSIALFAYVEAVHIGGIAIGYFLPKVIHSITHRYLSYYI